MLRSCAPFSAAALVLLCGCASTVSIPVWRNAESGISGVRQLAVLDFNGPNRTGQITRSAIVAQLSRNDPQREHYALVDQTELDQIAAVSSPTGTGPPNQRAAIEAARQLGVDTLLVGEVISYSAEDDKTNSQRFAFGDSDHRDGRRDTSDRHRDFEFENNETTHRDVTVSLAFRLIDVRTGRIRHQDTVTSSYSATRTNGEGEMLSKQAALRENLQDCARRITRMIVPHVDQEPVEIAGPPWGKGFGDIYSGNGAARKGHWVEAKRHWETALHNNPESDVAMHNLGVAHEAAHDYNTARRMYNGALRLKSSATYSRALRRAERHEQDYVALMRAPDRPRADGSQWLHATHPPQRPQIRVQTYGDQYRRHPAYDTPSHGATLPYDRGYPAEPRFSGTTRPRY